MSPAPRLTQHEQEDKILAAAADCIAHSSLLDFTMSSIAQAAGLSMGSIYKHIQRKEDVLVALATRVFGHLHQVFARVLALPLTLPERLVAISLLTPEKVQLYPFEAHLEMLIGNEAVLRRASSGWIERMTLADEAIDALFYQALQAAAESGELLVARDERDAIVEELLVAIWAMNVGHSQVVFQRHARSLTGRPAELPFPLPPDDQFIKTLRRLLNTYAWRRALTGTGIEKTCRLLAEAGLR